MLVYFSNISENTARFVKKLQTPAVRIPVDGTPLEVNEPYVLVVPTYGSGKGTRMLPIQVTKFLNNPDNRQHIKAVIAAGNTNFGKDYCKAGDIISAKCQVPLLYRFELLGTPEDVTNVQEILRVFWEENHPQKLLTK